MLARFEMETAKSAHTPMDQGLDLNVPSEKAEDVTYRKAVGSLMYLTVGTRPDISFAVCRLARFVESPSRLHWQCVKRVLRYLASTKELGICYRSNESLEPYGYVDSDYAGDAATKKSTSGYGLVMAGAVVS